MSLTDDANTPDPDIYHEQGLSLWKQLMYRWAHGSSKPIDERHLPLALRDYEPQSDLEVPVLHKSPSFGDLWTHYMAIHVGSNDPYAFLNVDPDQIRELPGLEIYPLYVWLALDLEHATSVGSFKSGDVVTVPGPEVHCALYQSESWPKELLAGKNFFWHSGYQVMRSGTWYDILCFSGALHTIMMVVNGVSVNVMQPRLLGRL